MDKTESVTELSDAQVPVIPFAISVPKLASQTPGAPTLEDSLVGNSGIVGTIVLLKNSAMIWVGWGKLDTNVSHGASSESPRTFVVGTGKPPQGQCLVAMPRTGYKGAFGTGSKEAPCSQIIGSASSDDQMLAAQMGSRLSTRSNMAVFVSCQFSGDDVNEWNAGMDTEVLSHRAAAGAEKEIWRILQANRIYDS